LIHLFDPILTEQQKTSSSQAHPLDSQHADLIRSLQDAFSTAAAEHFPSSTVGIFPTDSDSGLAILLVANKYSPQNFWNGRWRSMYLLNPSSRSVNGEIKVDVHYYEDGNVRMATSKKVGLTPADGAEGVVREIAKAENAFQEALNRGFTALAEGSFKSLRRQLPVTRQRVEWEKIGGYRVCSSLSPTLLCYGCRRFRLTVKLAWAGHRWWAGEILDVLPLRMDSMYRFGSQVRATALRRDAKSLTSKREHPDPMRNAFELNALAQAHCSIFELFVPTPFPGRSEHVQRATDVRYLSP